MSQPSLATDLRGFLTSKNGFDLGSRLVPKKKPSHTEVWLAVFVGLGGWASPPN
jgi:hypothetical protein